MVLKMSSCVEWRLTLAKTYEVYRDLLRDRLLCDVVLHAFSDQSMVNQDSAFFAHKIVLVAASPYFHDVFQQGLLNETSFRLPDGVDGDVFPLLLDYIYGVDIREKIVALTSAPSAAAAATRWEAPATAGAAVNDPSRLLDHLINSAKYLGLTDLAQKVLDYKSSRDAAAAAARAAAVAAVAREAAATASVLASATLQLPLPPAQPLTLVPNPLPHYPPPSSELSSRFNDDRDENAQLDEDDVDDDDDYDAYSLPTQVPYQQSAIRKRPAKANISPTEAAAAAAAAAAAPSTGVRLDLNNQYIKDLGDDKSDKNARMPKSKEEMAKYLRPHSILKVIQRFSEKERNTPFSEAVSRDSRKKDFSKIEGRKVTIGLKASQVWPWKATEVEVKGHLRTEAEPCNRRGGFHKDRIKLAVYMFEDPEEAGEEEEEEEGEGENDTPGDDNDKEEGELTKEGDLEENGVAARVYGIEEGDDDGTENRRSDADELAATALAENQELIDKSQKHSDVPKRGRRGGGRRKKKRMKRKNVLGGEEEEEMEGGKKRQKEKVMVYIDQTTRTFTCPFCDDRIKHKFSFAGHLVIAHGLIWKNQIACCNLCSFVTSRRAIIGVHAERIHGVVDPNKRMLHCRVCGNSYSNSSSLRVHESLCIQKQDKVPIRVESGYIHYEEEEEEEEEEVDDGEEHMRDEEEREKGGRGRGRGIGRGRGRGRGGRGRGRGRGGGGRRDTGNGGNPLNDDDRTIEDASALPVELFNDADVKIKVEHGVEYPLVKVERLDDDLLDAAGGYLGGVGGSATLSLEDKKILAAVGDGVGGGNDEGVDFEAFPYHRSVRQRQRQEYLERKETQRKKLEREKRQQDQQQQEEESRPKKIVKKTKAIKVYDYQKEHLCPHCGKSLKGTQNFKKHLLEHNGVQQRRFPCKEEGCNFICRNNLSLVSHLYSIHKLNIEGREIIHCPYCDYTTLLKPVMRRHLDFHENKRAFVCDAEGCGMAFNARGTLLRHKASQHEKQNKVNCPFCGVEFFLKTYLQQHLKLMHTERGVKNWKCGYCSHASALRGNCRKHQKNEHKGMKEWIVNLRKESPTVANRELEAAFPQMQKLVY